MESRTEKLRRGKAGRLGYRHLRVSEHVATPVARQLLSRCSQPVLFSEVCQIGNLMKNHLDVEDDPGLPGIGDVQTAGLWCSQKGPYFKQGNLLILG